MTIIVKSIKHPFKIVISEGKDKIEFSVRQLDYFTKNIITGMTTKIVQGQITIDTSLTCFYNLKFGLKRVKGLQGADKTDYKLKFEDCDGIEGVTDECIDELFATKFSDNLINVTL